MSAAHLALQATIVIDTRMTPSVQIIIPGVEAGKKNDIYVMWMGKSLQVAPDGWYICLLSTQLEGRAPEEELAMGYKLLPCQPAKQFITVCNMLVEFIFCWASGLA